MMGAIVFTSRVYTTHEDNQIRFMENCHGWKCTFLELGKIQIETKEGMKMKKLCAIGEH